MQSLRVCFVYPSRAGVVSGSTAVMRDKYLYCLDWVASSGKYLFSLSALPVSLSFLPSFFTLFPQFLSPSFLFSFYMFPSLLPFLSFLSSLSLWFVFSFSVSIPLPALFLSPTLSGLLALSLSVFLPPPPACSFPPCLSVSLSLLPFYLLVLLTLAYPLLICPFSFFVPLFRYLSLSFPVSVF